ncbi:Ubiquitin carboxyl-terminal hydrolase [Entamoeba marina]
MPVLSMNDYDFRLAIDHLKNTSKFPCNYISKLNLNTTKKFFAVPKDYVIKIYEVVLKLAKVNSSDREDFIAAATLPDIKSAVGIGDENNYLKPELEEGVDYFLISKHNKEMIETLYGYLTDLTDSPSLPIVYIHKEEDIIEKEMVPASLKIKVTVKDDDDDDDITSTFSKLTRLPRLLTVSQAKKKIKNIIDDDINFKTYQIALTKDGDEVDDDTILSSLIVNVESNFKINVVVTEMKMTSYPYSGTDYAYSSSSYGYNSYGYSNPAYERKGTKGVCGLQNLGNTCFMNSSIQCLIHTKPLVEFFFNDNWQNQINKDNPLGTGGNLVNAWSELVKKYWDEKACISPSFFKQEVGQFAPQFRGFQQHDSQELMSFVLDGLHEDLNHYDGEEESQWAKDEWERYKLRNDSIITDSFTGQFKSRVICKVCGRINLRFDPYVFLSVGIPRKQKIISVSVYDQDYKKLKKTKTDSTNKSIKQIIADVIEDADSSKDPNNYVMVAFGYGKKIDRIVTETPLSKKQQFVDDVKIVDVSFAYNNWKDIRLPVVVDATLSNVEIEKIIAKLFVEPNIFEKKSEPKVVSTEHTEIINSSSYKRSNKDMSDDEGESNKENKDDDAIELDKPNHDKKSSSAFEDDANNKESVSAEEFVVHDVPPVVHDVDVNMSVGDSSTEELKSSEEEPNSMIMEEVYEPFFEINDENETSSAFGIQKNVYRYVSEGYGYYGYSRSSVGDETVSLNDCLDAFEEEEDMDGDNTVYCSHCKEHQPSKKKMDIWSTNKVLVIHLKRFGNSSGYSRDKISTLVEFPINNLDMRNYVRQYDPNHPPIYNLYAVSNHSGSLGGGHYVASARVHTNNKWYDFNDSSTSEIPGDSRNIVSSSAYVLYYIRSDEDVVENSEQLDSVINETSHESSEVETI